MMGIRVAILSPVPEYEENWSHIKADYARLFGQNTQFIDWTKADDLGRFDLVTPLLAWGYPRDCPRWFALLDRMEAEGIPVSNPVGILRWNSDKAYLAELGDAGIATVPSYVAESCADADLAYARSLFSTDIIVAKPPISGGADGTYCLRTGDPVPADVAGQRMILQPFLPTIATEGEYSLFYFDGVFSHAIIKHPAKGDFRVQEQFGGYEEAIDPPAAACALAAEAMAAAVRLTGGGALTYARVDMLRDSEGVFRLMELELIEPSLFLKFAPDGGAAFAKALLAVA